MLGRTAEDVAAAMMVQYCRGTVCPGRNKQFAVHAISFDRIDAAAGGDRNGAAMFFSQKPQFSQALCLCKLALRPSLQKPGQLHSPGRSHRGVKRGAVAARRATAA